MTPSVLSAAATTVARLEAQLGMVELSKAEELLTTVVHLPEIKDLIASAEALKVFLRQADLGLINQNRATAIAIRARRKAGEISAQLKREVGGRPEKTSEPGDASFSARQLARQELGVTKRTLEKWQNLAATKTDADIEAAPAEATRDGRELTTAALMPRRPAREAAEDGPDPSVELSGELGADLAEVRRTLGRDYPDPERAWKRLPLSRRLNVLLDDALWLRDWASDLIEAMEEGPA